MFVVTIEQAIDDDFFGHWINRAIYALEGGSATMTEVMYEALHRWLKEDFRGSTQECLRELEDSDLRVSMFPGQLPGQLSLAYQERFTPLDHWAGGRHVNQAPAHCAVCDWYGAMRQMTHAYRLNSQAETEPVDFCPRCGTTLS